jgi:hypothetical protein
MLHILGEVCDTHLLFVFIYIEFIVLDLYRVKLLFLTYKVVQIWPELFTLVYIQISPGHIWTILYEDFDD